MTETLRLSQLHGVFAFRYFTCSVFNLGLFGQCSCLFTLQITKFSRYVAFPTEFRIKQYFQSTLPIGELICQLSKKVVWKLKQFRRGMHNRVTFRSGWELQWKYFGGACENSTNIGRIRVWKQAALRAFILGPDKGPNKIRFKNNCWKPVLFKQTS